MQSSKRTFLFIHKFMGIGGIQIYLIRTIKRLKDNGHRIIWIFPKGGYIDDSFKEQLLDGSVEIINVDLDKYFWINSLDIQFDKNEEVVALAFNLFNFVFIEKIKKKYSSTKIHSFFWVPHFKEKGIFIEEFAPSFVRPLFRRIIRKIIIDMDRNDNIIYVNKSHLDALTINYSYSIKGDYEKKLLRGSTGEVPDYDNNLNKVRSKRDSFNIITVGRFSFPHKAYILGLIRVYGQLKTKYNQLKLTIIGYGQDEDKVLEEIHKLPLDMQKDINFVGKVPYKELINYFNKAHLNVGVAGTIADGALTGLISIPVRHYSEVCEGYGYLPDSKHLTTSSDPGIPIEVYIEEVINMNNTEYLKLSKMGYDTYSVSQENSFDQLMNMMNMNYRKTLKLLYISAVTFSYRLAKMTRDIRRKTQGIFK